VATPYPMLSATTPKPRGFTTLRPSSRDPAWVITLLGGGIALLVTATMIATRLLVPSELAVIGTEAWGWTSDGVHVDAIGAGSPFQAGDLVVAMDGRPLERWIDDAVSLPWTVDRPALGDVVRFDVVRAGQALVIEAPRVPFPLERFGNAPVGLMIFGIGVLILSLALVARRPRTTALRVLFVGAAANVADIVAWELDLQPSDLALQNPFLVAFAAAAVFNLVFWACIVHVLLLYPIRSGSVSRHRLLLRALYAGPIVALAIAAPAVRLLGGTSLDWVDRMAAVLAAIVSGMVVLLLTATVAGYRRTPEPRRRQVRIIALSLGFAATAELVLFTVPIIALGHPLVTRNTVAILALPVPIALAFAVIRDRLFQVSLLASSRERIVAAREQERMLLRRELHDGLGPTLAALGLKLDFARARVRSEPETAERVLEEGRGDLRVAIAEIRRIARQLRPPALDTLGLVGALRQQAEGMMGAEAAGPVMMVVADEPLGAIPPATEVAAYRIAVEAMMNVVRHAGASRGEVRVWLDDDGLAIEVVDDGRGMGTSETGVGTRSMHERAAEVGGEVSFESAAGGGTRVVAHLPLDHVQAAGSAV
jgi:signal transduction histidine kinase